MTISDDTPLETMMTAETASEIEAALREVTNQLSAERNWNGYLSESLADAQMALDDIGWQRIGAESQREFTREGLLQSARLCRVYAIVNPLARRAISLRTAYIWGQGVQIQARSKGPDADNKAAQDVNAVVQSFMDDKGNRAAFFGSLATEQGERTLATDGVIFAVLPTSPLTGQVQIRTLDLDEITDVIRNPDDKAEDWYYERTWTEDTVELTATGGQTRSVQRKVYYPAVGYYPKVRVRTINGDQVRWDAPVVALKVNGLAGWKFGVGDLRSALPWLRGYKEFLEDWRTLVKALSKFAWQITAKTKAGRANVRDQLTTAPTLDPVTGHPLGVGATAVTGEGTSMEAIPKTGATIDSGSGRPLAAMVAAGMDVPVTMLLGDPGVTGARATAETLDQPMELAMKARQALHADFRRQILDYVIDQAVKAPRGPLKGTISRDPFTDRETITLAGDTDRTVEITWPDLSETPVDLLVRAISEADGTGKMPPMLIATLLMAALKVSDSDEWLEQLKDEQGNFVSPGIAIAQQAQDALTNGQDGIAGTYGNNPPPPPEPGTTAQQAAAD